MRKLITGLCAALALAWSLPALAAPQQTIVGPDGTPAKVDSNGLNINCKAGCSGGGGSVSNASSGVATTSTNSATVAYNYGFNGTTWDQLQVDGSKNLKVVIEGPYGRQADAASVSVGLSTEDVAALTPKTTSGTPCATATTAGCTIPDITALIAQTAANPILVGPTASPTALIQATTTAAITSTSATTTQIIAHSGTTATYITHYELVVSGAGTVNFISGTGGTCGSSTAFLTGATGHPMSYAANGGISAGSGLGPIMIAAAGQDVCIVTTGAVDTSGIIAYAQF